MAIDTAQRRLATITHSQVFLAGLVPDGTIAAGDRQAIALSYEGISAGEPVAFVPKPRGMLAAQHVRRSMRRYRGGRR